MSEVNQMEGSKAGATAGLEVSNMTASYRGTVAVNDISFDIPTSNFLTLLGPSGCGKSTTLRSVAGLHKIDSGEINIGGYAVAGPGVHVRPENRQINMVFQSYAIWPHMTVAENVAYGLKLMKKSRQEVRRKVGDMLDLVGLGDFADRPATGLSGGQQQRVALARALATNPSVLLLDEPLSNLDSVLRIRMRSEILRIQKETGTTTLYVTHDCAEALSMSDRIVVMNQGRIAQADTPENLYRYPANRFVANFLGQANVLAATVAEIDANEILAEVPGIAGLRLKAVRRGVEGSPEIGQKIELIIRPEDMGLAPPGATQRIPAQIVQREYLGNRTEVTVCAGNELLKMDAVSNLEAAVGDAIEMAVRSEDITWTTEV